MRRWRGLACHSRGVSNGQPSSFITALPKVELHLHLEGTLSPETLLRLVDRNGLDFPYGSVGEIRAALAARPAGLEGFLDHHYVAVQTIQTRQDFTEVAYELLRECRASNIVWVEVFFDPQFHTSRGIPFESVIEGITEGLEAGSAEFGVEAGLIMCINRERSERSAVAMLDQARPYRELILGLGMDSYEEGNPPSKFARAYAAAREDGYRLTAHCDVDQSTSVSNIWEAVDVLRVERIDHGLNAVEDPGLVEVLRERSIGLTACPVRRPTDPEPQDLDRIRQLFEAGVLVTLNTDDPAEFDTGYLTTLMSEVQSAGGYTNADMVRFVQNAFEISWLPQNRKDDYLAVLSEYAEGDAGA